MRPTVWLAALLLVAGSAGAQGTGNLLPNGSFELVEPPAPTAAGALSTQPLAPESSLPRTWNLWGQGGATVRLLDDPKQAHAGRRVVQGLARQGQVNVRYGPLPVPDRRPWDVKLWARGSGRLVLTAFDATTEPWRELPVQTWALGPAWTELAARWNPPEGCGKWWLSFATQGPTECLLDDAGCGTEGSVAPPWPPVQPLGRDPQTLLYLDFEKPLNPEAFYVGGRVNQTAESLPGFGKALEVGAEGYVACSADESFDPRCGTLEVWVKLLSPGAMGLQQPFVSIPGMEGMWLGKDQYNHIGFSFSSGWAPLSSATALGYAGSWQPCWRHVAACWDAEALQLFVDGKLIAWQTQPRLSRFLGPELRLGAPGVVLDDLRISRTVRYRLALPPPQ